jgi:superfamily II DNA or RNA helicase
VKTPRDYQLEAEAAVRRELSRVGSTLLVLPTGTGKTVVMARLAAGWERGNVLLLAHRIELLDQAAEKLSHELGYLPVVEQGERAMDVGCLWQGGAVLVGSVQTLANESRRAKFGRHPFDLVLIDEAHHATAASYTRVIDHFRALNPQLKVLGVTATPKRADETALGLVFDTLAYEMPIWDGIELGWLVPVEQEYVAVDEVDFSHVGLGKNEVGESDLKAQDLEAVLVEEEALHALARPIAEKAGERQCLVFTSGVAHAHGLAAVLNRYRQGSAKAVDGRTDKKERREAVEAFSRGGLQFLTNFGVFTEGFDAPSTSLVAMGRPTKSVGLYTQMLGRGTRPLPGVVDGPATPDARRAAIAASAKPRLLVLDFVGNSRHKLVSSVDVLGGNYDVEARDLARRRVAAKRGADVGAELKKARAEIALRREQERRRGIVARVGYTTQAVDPFGHGPAPAGDGGAGRGGATDAQVGLLVSLGVERATALAYGKGQAGKVIESLKAKRCTGKQRAILERYGESADVNFAEASAIIDEIAGNGWRGRRVTA